MDLLADHIRIGTELRLPESAGDNRGERRPGIVIRLGERTPDDRTRSEHPVHARCSNGNSCPDGGTRALRPHARDLVLHCADVGK